MHYTDLDADVTEALLSLSGPGLSSEPMVVPISGSEGLTRAEVTIRLQAVPPSPGEYQIEVVLRDEENNNSAPAYVSFVAR